LIRVDSMLAEAAAILNLLWNCTSIWSAPPALPALLTTLPGFFPAPDRSFSTGRCRVGTTECEPGA